MPVNLSFAFDAAWILAPGALVILVLLALTARKLAQRGLPWAEIAAVLVLRGIALAELLFLAARPVTVQHSEKHS